MGLSQRLTERASTTIRCSMHIGVVPRFAPSGGGLHQYTLAVLEGLARLSGNDLSTQYTLFLRPEDEIFLHGLSGGRWGVAALNPPPEYVSQGSSRTFPRLRGLLRRVRNRIAPPRKAPDLNRILRRPEYGRWFQQHGVGWIFYTAPTGLSFEAGVPYIMPVHDLQHRLQPEFPEVSANGEWDTREYLFRNGVRYATLILADSETGKEDILTCYGAYGVKPDRVRVLPYPPASYLPTRVDPVERHRVRARYQLPARYLFYPAQFWPHKNHVRILRAMGQLKAGRCEVHIVFCGDYDDEIRARTFAEVMAVAQHLDLGSQVHYVGYVPNADMAGLYGEALGLIMPTFFGPTNIPVVEAWALGCAVLTSDIRGIREQVGDAGLLVDPRSVPAIADGIRRLWEDERLRRVLTERGRGRFAAHTVEDFTRRLAGIIREANELVAYRGTSDFAEARSS